MNKTSIVILGDFADWYGTNRINFYKAISKNDIDEIDVFLSSYGGEVAEALTIYDMLKGHKAKVNIYLSGVVASAATIVACAGDKIIASPTNIYMIHKGSFWVGGNATDLRQAAEILDVFDDKIVSIYERKVTAKGKLKKETIWKLLNQSTWMTSETAADLGFVDSVEDFTFDFEGQQIGWGIFASDPKAVTTVENYETNIKVIQSAIKTSSIQFIQNNSKSMKILNSIAEKVVQALTAAGFISEENKNKAIENIADVDFENETITNIVQKETSAIFDNSKKDYENKITALTQKLNDAETKFKDFETKVTDALASHQFAGFKNQGGTNGESTQEPNNEEKPKLSQVKIEFFREALANGSITQEEFKKNTGLEE